MELNGAVLSKLCRKMIEAESRLPFGKVYQLVDSETVLGMIHKMIMRFRVYEGVRIGEILPAWLKPAPPFTSVMLDQFGPYPVRGEVQKRTTGKAWGVIFTDICCRAVHLEVVFGYDTESFLLAFSRLLRLEVGLRLCTQTLAHSSWEPGRSWRGSGAILTKTILPEWELQLVVSRG